MFQKCDCYHYSAKNVLGGSWNRRHGSSPNKLAIKGAILQFCVRRQTAMAITAVPSNSAVGRETPEKRKIQVWGVNHGDGKGTSGRLYGNQLPSDTAPNQKKIILVVSYYIKIYEFGRKMRETRIYDSGFWFYTCMRIPGKLRCCFLALLQKDTKYFSPSSLSLFSILREMLLPPSA